VLDTRIHLGRHRTKDSVPDWTRYRCFGRALGDQGGDLGRRNEPGSAGGFGRSRFALGFDVFVGGRAIVPRRGVKRDRERVDPLP
jgi:hypothetical protein